MRWWTSDLHVNHQNIIDFCGRPFYKEHVVHFALGDSVVEVPDVDAMNQALLDNYNSVVAPADEVWFVGDLVMGRFETSIEFMRQFHGDKYLIPGNHDRCHKMLPKWRKWQPYYEAVGFTVLDSQVTTKVGNQDVKVCHFPYTFTHPSDDRYSVLRPDDTGEWLIHGHTHDTERFDLEHRTIHVGVDAWDYFPVSESAIEKIISGIS
jgi:calcineurin-like phosphoesterase family protein